MKLPTASSIHFDIDDYLNRLIPPSQLYRLPRPISHFLGYRKTQKVEVGNVLICCWAFLGTFCGLALVSGVFQTSQALKSYNPPILIASFGATAILEYNTIQSPLAQPRNSILGHSLSAILGVAITKLFMLSPHFESIRWIAGCMACAFSTSVMGITNTVHPPGGATALLAAIEPSITAMGWNFVPVVLVGSCLMLVVALLLNNIQRRFPVYWWTPRDVGRKAKKTDIEIGPKEEERKTQDDRSESSDSEQEGKGLSHQIVISADTIRVPYGFTLGPEQEEILEVLRDRLRSPPAEELRPTRSFASEETFS